mmetsp:Transcript_1751/g.4838  ORF Transcript_1751/g.4838 Transcript_1751/m.4838 type:complete len:236 (+) Transcript_1751:11-718(+)
MCRGRCWRRDDKDHLARCSTLHVRRLCVHVAQCYLIHSQHLTLSFHVPIVLFSRVLMALHGTALSDFRITKSHLLSSFHKSTGDQTKTVPGCIEQSRISETQGVRIHNAGQSVRQTFRSIRRHPAPSSVGVQRLRQRFRLPQGRAERSHRLCYRMLPIQQGNGRQAGPAHQTHRCSIRVGPNRRTAATREGLREWFHLPPTTATKNCIVQSRCHGDIRLRHAQALLHHQVGMSYE